MPKETFFNLPADKRERLVEVALDELSRCSYDNASVSRMVAAAEIAKGSFYQYFEDKLDLFGWLIEEAGRRRSAWFASLPVPAPADPFDRLRFAYREGLGFWRAEPRWSRVGLRLWEPSEDPRFAARRAHAEGLVHRFLVDLLRDGQERGYVRADLDVEAGAWLVSGLLQEGLLRAFAEGRDVHQVLNPATGDMLAWRWTCSRRRWASPRGPVWLRRGRDTPRGPLRGVTCKA